MRGPGPKSHGQDREVAVDGKGMAASLLAVKLDDVQAVVLGAGIYDFKEAYDEVTIKGIKCICENMENETGLTPGRG